MKKMPLTNFDFVNAALYFLAYTKGCRLICAENGINSWLDRPDAFGICNMRFTYEIEIKATVADFRVDKKKRKWKLYEKGHYAPPAYFWYLVPNNIVEKVKGDLPKCAGLLTPNKVLNYEWVPDLTSVVRVTKNIKYKKPSLREMVRMVRNQSNSLMRARQKLAMLINNTASRKGDAHE